MPAAPPQTDKPDGLWDFLRFLLFIAVATFILRAFIVAPFSIPTGSMLPKLMVGDYLFVTKWNYGFSRYSLPFKLPLIDGRVLARLPARGDVVVFKYPGPSRVDYVKRVIGLPGDRVQVRGGQLILNGKPVPRTRIADWPMPVSPNSPCRLTGEDVRDEGDTCIYPRYREILPSGRAYEVLDAGRSRFDDTRAFVIPADHLFMMGDNRDDSLDSRAAVAERGVGFVPIELLVGKAGIGFFSTDGSASLFNPLSWGPAARFERIGATY